MNGTTCPQPKSAHSIVWCDDHKAKADKVWENPDPRYTEASKKPAIVDVQAGDQYL